MTRISDQLLRMMWLILLSSFTLSLLAVEAASAPADTQAPPTAQAQPDPLLHHSAAQDAPMHLVSGWTR